tara:strand:- start:1155 stop:1502 length:348 start_codon:yes stop_codon:yes gene_type:complete
VNLKHIYKIITNEELQEAKLLNIYSGSIKDIQDGFIHFSAEEQIKETLNRHYPNKENLILLKVNAFKLEHLLWEQASNGDMYPHLYSKLDIKNVEDEFELKLDENGNHKLPKQFK